MTDEDVGPATSFQSALVRRVAIHESFFGKVTRKEILTSSLPVGQFIRLRRKPQALPVDELLLRRISLKADSPPKPWRLRSEASFSAQGVGGYAMEVPRALPVGLHKILSIEPLPS